MTGLIIGIGHVRRAGKDSAATSLCRDLGFRRVSFADRLKELAFHANPLVTHGRQSVNVGTGHGRLQWIVKGMGGWEAAKDSHPEVRLFLQHLGVGCRKVFGEDFWIEQALRTIKPGEKIVIPDVRFPNEAQAIKDLGGVVVRIDRPGHRAEGHESETALVDWEFDHVIDNSDSLMDLEQRMVELARKLLDEKNQQLLIPELG